MAPVLTRNIVIFGETGAGKSSVINLMAGEEIAHISSDSHRCTLHWTEYQITFENGTRYKVFDTAGLAEPRLQTRDYLTAISDAYGLINTLKERGGVNLLLFCIRGGRVTPTMQSNYRLFFEFLCEEKVPLALVVTNLEREARMEDWYTRNTGHLEKHNIRSAGHACITAANLLDGRHRDKFEESRSIIRRVVEAQHTRDKNQSQTVLEDYGNMPVLSDVRNTGSPQNASMERCTSRSSLSDKSFLNADATQYPGQFGGDDELPPAFFHGIETDVDPSPHTFANALFARISSLRHRFRPGNCESTELPQPSGPSMFHPHTLLARLSSFIHSPQPENDALDELQQSPMPSREDPRMLLASLSSLIQRSRLNTATEDEPHPTTSSSSRPDAPITRLSSLFRSRPHTDKKIKLAQLPSQPHVVEVAAVRDKQALVVARGPQFEKAKRAHEQQTQSHAQAQASSSHTQPANTSTSATPPAQGTAATQSPPIPWWAQVVLFLCCASPPYDNGHQRG
ncbi:hypothetical protein CY34DRAFT_804415 [Suillus luteus UH-Slu-Lm8-n1]|uniref:G domain-containing protein n=1 Tax=Suillus luteus UH-Slu-Lm8-n1 TaxID=930992 RepID=A0A0D0BIC7_9AGAM|nr:hypothetical protein CY34DRAFT_804415 [Suillus luteus UH-Slu-Lm8-n1]